LPVALAVQVVCCLLAMNPEGTLARAPTYSVSNQLEGTIEVPFQALEIPPSEQLPKLVALDLGKAPLPRRIHLNVCKTTRYGLFTLTRMSPRP
jgi:hypothetical protein